MFTAKGLATPSKFHSIVPSGARRAAECSVAMQVIQQRRLLSRLVKLLLLDPLHVLARQRLVLSAACTFTMDVEPAADRSWPPRMRAPGRATPRAPRVFRVLTPRATCARSVIAPRSLRELSRSSLGDSVTSTSSFSVYARGKSWGGESDLEDALLDSLLLLELGHGFWFEARHQHRRVAK